MRMRMTLMPSVWNLLLWERHDAKLRALLPGNPSSAMQVVVIGVIGIRSSLACRAAGLGEHLV